MHQLYLRAFTTCCALVTANFLYACFVSGDYPLAFERSFFQFGALLTFVISLHLTLRLTPKK